MNAHQEKENTVSALRNRFAKSVLSDKSQPPRGKTGTPLQTLAEAQGAPKPKPTPQPRTKKYKGFLAFLQKHRPEMGLRVMKVAGRSFLAGAGHTATFDGPADDDDVVLDVCEPQERINMLGWAKRGWAAAAGGSGSGAHEEGEQKSKSTVESG